MNDRLKCKVCGRYFYQEATITSSVGFDFREKVGSALNWGFRGLPLGEGGAAQRSATQGEGIPLNY